MSGQGKPRTFGERAENYVRQDNRAAFTPRQLRRLVKKNRRANKAKDKNPEVP